MDTPFVLSSAPGPVKGMDSQTLSDRFERQAAATPHLPAVVTLKEAVTYSELQQLVTRIAAELAQLPHSEKPVALLMREGPLLFATMLAAAKANRIFIPLEVTGAENWLARVVTSCVSACVISDRPGFEAAKRIAPGGVDVLLAEDLSKSSRQAFTESHATGDDIAFVIYTSGSTGQPKGVAADHKFVLHRIKARQKSYDFRIGDRYGHVRSCGYSAGLNTALAALLSGAGVYAYDIRSEGLHRMASWLNAQKITQLALTSSLFRTWLAALPAGYQLPHLRVLLASAEPLYGSDLARVSAHLTGDWRLIHNFSSTETGVVTTGIFGISSAQTEGALPVGTPISDIEVSLEDDNGKSVPCGEVGEIVVRADCMARGYWNDPEGTAAKFLVDVDGRHVYRTRDFGRFRPDGMLEHFGRKDRKIKLRGYSVEPHEVECALLRVSGVRDTAVVVDGVGDDARLVAFVSGPDVSSKETGSNIRNQLMRDLPPQLVPAEITVLGSLPLTPRGKIDRKALLKHRSAAAGSTRAPTNSYERLLFDIWRKALRRNDFGIDDSFQDLGGTSLQGFLIFSWLDTLGWDLPPSMILEAPTVAQQAAILRDNALSLGAARRLVPFRVAGESPALFFLHARKGDILYVRELLASFGVTRSIYGLRPSPLDGTSSLPRSVEAIAAGYIAEMQGIQPQGPYHVCGYSFGGTLALEIARQLSAEGQSVGLVGLIDTVHWGDGRRAFKTKSPLRKAFSALYSFGVTLFYLPDELRLLAGRPIAFDRRMDFYGHVYGRASRRYKRRPYAGPVALFSSKGRVEHHRESWSPIAQGGLEIVELPGNHRDIVWPPTSALLASALEASIAASEVPLNAVS